MGLETWRRFRGAGRRQEDKTSLSIPKNVKSSKFRAIFGCLLLSGMGIYVFDMAVISHHAGDIQSKGFIVDTPGCRIPNMEMFDAHIRHMIWKVNPLDCKAGSLPQLVSSNLTSLFVVKSSLRYHDVWNDADLRCCYRPYWRIEADDTAPKSMADSSVSYSEECHLFGHGANILDEFVKVECRYASDKLIYVDYFAFTPLKLAVEERCARHDANRDPGDARGRGVAANEVMDADSSEDAADGDNEEGRRVSVLIMGIDSVSRLNFHRQMITTDSLLGDLGAIEMLGYNKVSDNTFPNLVAILTGISWTELQDKCWPTYGHTFDDCHFLWSNFSEAGYRTAFAEDDTISGIFNYMKLGFAHQPTDYYMRPYHRVYEDASKSLKNLISKPNNIGRLGIRCIGPRSNPEVLFEYATKFAKTMARKRYFGLFWESTLTHDYVNDAQQLDESLQSTLQKLSVSGALDDTVMIVMSDHGLRFGDIRSTFQGWLEDRLPLLTFTFPKWFHAKYPKAVANLRQNIRQLTTPFDLHYTLSDFLDLTQLTDSSIARRTNQLNAAVQKTRGQSLFLPVSKSRSCVEAGIDDHYCTCQRSVVVSADDSNVQEAAAFLVRTLDELLLPFPACAQLELARVVSARRQFPIDDLDSRTTEKIVDFVVVIETTPGMGLFEATVRQLNDGFQFASEEMEVSRVNQYANQSWCVTDFKMKLYCYCLNEMKAAR